MYWSTINIKSKLYFNDALPDGFGINLLYLLGVCCIKTCLSSYTIILIIKLIWETVSNKKTLFFPGRLITVNLDSITSFSSCKVPFKLGTVDNIFVPFDSQKLLEEFDVSEQLQGALNFGFILFCFEFGI